MGFFLVFTETLSDFKHIHVIIMSLTGISGKITILLYDMFYRTPTRTDIRTDTPGTCHILRQSTGESPTTDIDGNIRTSGIPDSLTNSGITFLFFKSQFLGATIIYLDEIIIPLFQIEVHILLFMSIKAGTYSVSIIIIDGSTSVVPRI